MSFVNKIIFLFISLICFPLLLVGTSVYFTLKTGEEELGFRSVVDAAENKIFLIEHQKSGALRALLEEIVKDKSFLGASGEVFVFSKEGTTMSVVARTNDSSIPGDSIVAAAREAFNGDTVNRRIDDPTSHVVYARMVPGTTLTVVMQKNWEESINSLGLFRDYFLLFAFMSVIISVAMALIFSRKITESLLQVMHSAEEFGRGNFTTRVSEDVEGEFFLLATAFNSMADKIEEHNVNLEHQIELRTKQLHESNEKLETINEELLKRMAEVQELNKHMVGRELKMIELKKEIAELQSKLIN